MWVYVRGSVPYLHDKALKRRLGELHHFLVRTYEGTLRVARRGGGAILATLFTFGQLKSPNMRQSELWVIRVSSVQQRDVLSGGGLLI